LLPASLHDTCPAALVLPCSLCQQAVSDVTVTCNIPNPYDPGHSRIASAVDATQLGIV
jgi:hypothetical protein